MVYIRNLGTEEYHSPNSSMDREDLNRWFCQERSLEILPSTQPGDVGRTILPRSVLSTLKRKAVEQPLSVTQNILSEVLADSTPENNQTLPTMESLARVVQRSRAVSSGSAQHTEATSFSPYLHLYKT
ncbi:hypothetical protein ACHWQZ_G009625 [Mnemiopsis leidyi]